MEPSGTSLPSILTPGTMWRSNTFFSSALFAISLLSESTGTLSKAALVGAKTVKGPAPARFSIMTAAIRAATLLPGLLTAVGALVGVLGMVLMFGLRRWWPGWAWWGRGGRTGRLLWSPRMGRGL